MKTLKVVAHYHCIEPRIRVWVPAHDLLAAAQRPSAPTYDWSESEARGILWALMDQFPDVARAFSNGEDQPE